MGSQHIDINLMGPNEPLNLMFLNQFERITRVKWRVLS